MRSTFIVVVVAGVLAGCATYQPTGRPVRKLHPVTLQAMDKNDPEYGRRLDTYFAEFCDLTANLGIGFVASHTFDYDFRQRLKTTQDLELKRLYVLHHLYQQTEGDLRAYEDWEVQTGRTTRRMTTDERKAARDTLIRKLSDLSSFDPGDSCGDIQEFKERLESVP